MNSSGCQQACTLDRSTDLFYDWFRSAKKAGLFYSLVCFMAKEPELIQAIRFICEEKGLPMEMVVSTIEAALAAAFRKDFGEPNQNIQVELDRETGLYKVFDVKTVVQHFTEEEIEAQREELKTIREAIQTARDTGKEAPASPEESGKVFYNPKLHLMIDEAQKVKKGAEEGEEIRTPLEVPSDFGRMAAQTAKQVITQKLREAERSTIFDEFKDKVGEILMGIVQRREGRNVLVDLGRATGLLPYEEQVHGERYNPGQRVKVFVMGVEMGPKGPQIRLSRSHEDIVRQLFALEIPEVANGAIEIMAIAREAGSRSKVAVRALEEGIDPIGSCVGQRGTRVQTIINELGGEKIDIIEWEEDLHAYLPNALAPAKVLSIDLNEDGKTARVHVAEDQLSLAIGRSGQNVRLASRLTGWTINIEGAEKPQDAGEKEGEETGEAAPTEAIVVEPVKETSEPSSEDAGEKA